MRSGPETLTYRHLQAAADDWTARLTGSGVRPGDAVAVLIRRTTDLVAAVLGIVQSGAVYVPLEISYPVPRMQTVVHDCGARVLRVTTAGRAASRWPHRDRCPHSRSASQKRFQSTYTRH